MSIIEHLRSSGFNVISAAADADEAPKPKRRAPARKKIKLTQKLVDDVAQKLGGLRRLQGFKSLGPHMRWNSHFPVDLAFETTKKIFDRGLPKWEESRTILCSGNDLGVLEQPDYLVAEMFTRLLEEKEAKASLFDAVADELRARGHNVSAVFSPEDMFWEGIEDPNPDSLATMIQTVAELPGVKSHTSASRMQNALIVLGISGHFETIVEVKGAGVSNDVSSLLSSYSIAIHQYLDPLTGGAWEEKVTLLPMRTSAWVALLLGDKDESSLYATALAKYRQLMKKFRSGGHEFHNAADND